MRVVTLILALFGFAAAAAFAADTSPPLVTQLLPAAGTTNRSLRSVEVFFNENVSGVDAADLLINGQPAQDLSFFGAAHYLFEFVQPATGRVQFAWSPGHGIRDLASNNFAGAPWSVTFDPRFGVPNIVISELMAANVRTTNDIDGQSSDWIELFNAGVIPVNLDGWFLTDTPFNPAKWRFPNYTMAANSYLIVWASGKNRTNVTAQLHASFKLAQNGGYLALLGPETNVVSEFSPEYPGQENDISYGRDPADPSLTGFYTTPTPGRRNTTGGAGQFAPDVVFSTNSTTFVRPFSLTLSLATSAPNAVIRYSLGTALPGSNSTLYTGPIAINGSVQVRARAFVPGLFPGDIRSEQYLQIHSNVTAFTSGLPLMILHNNGGGAVPSSADQFVMVQTFQPVNGRSSLTNTPNDRARGIFHRRGSSTLGLAKSSFFLETQDDFGNDKDESLLGLPADSDWVLYAPNNFDPGLIHNPVGYELARQSGRYASRTRFVVVFLKDDSIAGLPISTNDYNGIYVLEEKPKISGKRLDIGKLESGENTPPGITGGYLLSIDRASPGEAQFVGAGQKLNWINPHYAEITLPQRDAQEQYLLNYFAQFDAALNGLNWTNPVTGYAAWIDVDSWIDYNLIAVVTRNVDELELSTYLHKARDGRIGFGPVWDFDRSQGGTDGRDFGPRVWNCGRSADHFGYSWWGRLFTDPNFWQHWIDRYQQLRQGSLANTNVLQLIDGFANEVRAEQPREEARWGVHPRSGNGTGCSFSYSFGNGGFQNEVNWLKAWYSNRFDFIDHQLEARPAFGRPPGFINSGSTLTLTGPAGATIYYTLDGTDPRAPGGGIASNARAYTGPFVVSANVRVMARSRDLSHVNATGGTNPRISSPWSGPSVGTFYTKLPALAVTEIMYHPANPPAPDTSDPDHFEFIELKNTGPTAINLVGMRFTNGIEFAFTATNAVTSIAPGAYLVVVNNRADFAARYPAVLNIAGEFGGNLDNNGERIYLEGVLGEPIVDFRYEQTWIPSTDGDGFSLVLSNESAAPANYANPATWRRSSDIHGSPGRADPALDTDGDGMPDDWELANGTNPLVPDANADPDHDGMTNLQEYLAGTNPTNPLSVLRLSVTLNNGAQLAFFAASNKSYSILRRTNLLSGSWQRVFDVPMAATNRSVTFRDTSGPVGNPHGFYRLVTPQSP
ncbi:MAG: hypothetical protein QOF48_598 [Verrucomicrobiota bacterium]